MHASIAEFHESYTGKTPERLDSVDGLQAFKTASTAPFAMKSACIRVYSKAIYAAEDHAHNLRHKMPSSPVDKQLWTEKFRSHMQRGRSTCIDRPYPASTQVPETS
jgi:hypothetical protein